MYCEFCGDHLEGRQVCPSCGRQMSSMETETFVKRKRGIPKFIVLLLIIFVPYIGFVLVPFSDFDKRTKKVLMSIFVILIVVLILVVIAFQDSHVEMESRITEEVVSIESKSIDDKNQKVLDYMTELDESNWQDIMYLDENTPLEGEELFYAYGILREVGLDAVDFVSNDGSAFYMIDSAQGEVFNIKVVDGVMVSIYVGKNKLFQEDKGILDYIDN